MGLKPVSLVEDSTRVNRVLGSRIPTIARGQVPPAVGEVLSAVSHFSLIEYEDPMNPNVRISYPDYFDSSEGELVAKGYFGPLLVRVGNRRFLLTFFDPTRLSQEITYGLNSPNASFIEKNIVVVETVDRAHIDGALRNLTDQAFDSFVAEQ